MKFPPIYAALICASLMTTPAHLFGQFAATSAAGAIGPKLTFLTNEFHFGKVTAGTLVKHIFIASNAGDQTLVISKVTPGCHCTTAGGNWSQPHKVEPGKTEDIPIQFDSGSFRGDVTKTITVDSNDKLAPKQMLTLRGTIWRPIEVNPQFAYINITPDAPSNLTTVVHISNQSDGPVTLSQPSSGNSLFKAELKTIKPGREFEVAVSAVPPLSPGNNTGTISVKTSLTNSPVIMITAIANVQPAVEVSPLQITLPPQLSMWTTNLVRLTDKSSKPLVLSDPEASDKRISVALKETKPGSVFQLAAVFPPGYQVATGKPTQVSVKSNNPQQPVITVAIRQMQQRQPAMNPPQVHPRAMTQNLPTPPVAGHP
ncbi:MAG: DUF1573 domain-containing protein [Verrucomicrobiota bacterium]